MLSPIVHLLMYIGDAILSILQDNFLTTAPILVEAQSDQYKDFNLWAFLGIVLSLIGFVVGICLAIPTGGTSLIASVKCFAIGAAVCTTSVFAFQFAGSEFLDDWDGVFDIPMIQYTPYAIFSGQIPALDVNFIDPMENTYDTTLVKETEIKNDYKLNDSDFQDLVKSINASGVQWRTIKKVVDPGAEVGNPDITLNGIDLYNGKSWSGIIFEINTAQYSKPAYDYSLWIEREPDDMNWNDQSTSQYLLVDRTIYHYTGVDVTFYNGDNYWELTKVNLDEFIEEMDIKTQGNGTIIIPEQTIIKKEYKSSSNILQSGIATWYKVLRTVALVGLLSVLVYIGIRILLTSVAADKAKYKKMLVDWLVAVCMLFILHYLMVFILTISTSLTKIVIPKATNNLVFSLPKDTKLGTEDGTTPLIDYANQQLQNMPSQYTLKDEDNLITDETGRPTWIGDYVGYIRLIAGVKTTSTAIVYGIMYLVLVIYTCMFTFMYLKRVLYMAFLTMIAPLIALTYPLDKIKDGKAQAFSLWLREYMFNALIQPVHLILYTMLMSNVLNLAVEHPVYALVALGFFTPAERFIRKMFGFESAGTISAFGQIAGGAAVMSAVNKLSKLNKRKKKDEEGDSGKVRTKEEGGFGLPFAPGGNGESPLLPEGASESGASSPPRDASEPGDSSSTRDASEPGASSSPRDASEPGASSSPRDASEPGASSSPRGASELGASRQQQGNSSEEAAEQKNKNRILAGMNKVGNHYRKKMVKAKPLRAAGRWTGRIIGGAALGTVGLAAGIASGDPSKALSYTAAGAGVGGGLGGTVAENAMDEGKEIRENFSKGYQGESGYINKKLDKEYYNGTGNGESFQDLVEQEDLKGDLKGRERTRALKKEVQQYRKSGITENGQISTCMRAGLTPEEGVYAVQISKAMEKSGWNSPKTKKEYEANCRTLLRNQAISEDRINKIWNTVPNLLF